MRILYHHRTLSKDGQTVHIDELISALRRAGHEVLVVGPTAYQNACFGSDGGFATRLRAILPRAVAEVLELSYSVIAFFRLWRAWRRFRPDALYERYNLFMLAGVWLKALTGIPFALEVNAPLVLERGLTRGLALKTFGRICEAIAWRSADVVLPVTNVLAQHVLAAGVPAERIEVIANGIDPRHFRPRLSGDAIRARHGLQGKIVIGFTGFLRIWHGVPAIVDVIRELRASHDVHFLLVGDGEGRDELLRMADAAGVGDRITVTGVVSRAEIPAHVAAFDIAVQFKATEYASPLKLFEYMGLARAVVAPDQDNLREILVDNLNAVLFVPDDIESLRGALRRLVVDDALRSRVAAGAYATVVDRDLTWDGNARRVATALGRLADRRVVRPIPRPAAVRSSITP